MKKLYFNPLTLEVKLHSGMLMQQLEAGSDAQQGAWGAPEREPGGEFFPL